MRPAAAQHEVEALRQAVHERDQEIAMLRAQVARLDGLEAEIRALRAQLRSEAKDRAKLEARLKELLAKRKRAADALASHPQLFEDPVPEPTLPCVKEAPDGETAQDVIRPRHRRTKEPRKIAYAALPREYVTHELSRNERVCKATGLPLVEVDSKVFEELAYRP